MYKRQAIFKPKSNRPADFPIGHCRTDPVEARRLSEAGRADVSIRRFERQSAYRAAALEEIELSPAFAAEAVDFIDDGPAPAAAGREPEIQDETEKARTRLAELHRFSCRAVTLDAQAGG